MLGVRMPPAARQRLERASKAHGLTLSEYMRRAVEAAIDAEDAVPGIEPSSAVA